MYYVESALITFSQEQTLLIKEMERKISLSSPQAMPMAKIANGAGWPVTRSGPIRLDLI